jgi:fatty-acyl-CoA synthase
LAMLIGDILRNSARRFPNRTAIIDGETKISYAALEARVNRLAHAVLALNLEKGDKVAIMSTSRLEYALAYFAIARTKNVSVHLSTRGTVDDVIFMLNKVQATVWLFESRFAPVAAATIPGVPSLRTIIAFGEVPEDSALLPECLRLNDFESGHPEHAPEVDIQETDPVAITLTGGTTGFQGCCRQP